MLRRLEFLSPFSVNSVVVQRKMTSSLSVSHIFLKCAVYVRAFILCRDLKICNRRSLKI